ncbi:hypothetical protein TNCV_2716811 [Trichonephila clavipes]|nr:hypothetical protein TNCV_2716811 [Trichonephila clavipes]
MHLIRSLPSLAPSWDIASTQDPNPLIAHKGYDVSIANPMLSLEELIINIHFPLQSAYGEEFIYTAGVTDIAFPLEWQ